MKFSLFFIFFIFQSCSQVPIARTDKLSILQGLTSEKEVEFSVVADKILELKFELRDANSKIILPEDQVIISKDFSTFSVHKIFFNKEAKKDYNLFVFNKDKLIDQRLVGKEVSRDQENKIIVASCLNDYYPEYFKIWDSLISKRPDYLLLIGDNVYVNKKSKKSSKDVDPKLIWNRYIEVRLKLPLFYSEKLIPTVAIWDDNDYGMSDGDDSYQYKKESLEIFGHFWAQSFVEENWIKGPGASGLLSLGDFNFYFLDGRFFRSKNSYGSHLGEDQENWLFEKLKEESGPSFLIKGDQFFGGYHQSDSYEGKHPESFSEFVEKIASLNTPIIFLSGDRHMSEIMQFPRSLFKKPSFEITSGPLHNEPRKDLSFSNPWLVVNELRNPNFIEIKNLAQDNHWFLDVESVGINGESYFKRELAVYIKDLQNNLNEIRKRRKSGRRRFYRRVLRRKKR